MTALTETLHAGAFLISEANGTLSREKVTIAASQTLLAGRVLGTNEDGNYVAYDDDAATANSAKGILFDDVTTGVGETKQATAIVRLAEVRAADLDWGSDLPGADTGDVTAGIVDLAALLIILR